MSERMRRYLPTLKRIHRLGECAKKKLIKDCDRKLIECFCECSKNILKGNVPLKQAQMKRLRREKNLRALALKKTSLKKKRKILQKGGFIGAILPPILTVLSSLLGGLVGGNGAR